MKPRTLLCGALCATVLFALAGSMLLAGEPKGHAYDGKKGGAQPGQDQAKMDAWMKLAAPGKFHAHLKPLLGTWKTVSKWWTSAEAEPAVSEGTSQKKLILGGRFVQENYHSTAMGMPFQGVGLMGYDNAKKKYTSVWIDTMSTTMMTDSGTCNESGKVFTFRGAIDDPFTGQKKKIRTVLTIVNNDRHVLEMYETPQGGKEYKSLDVTYARG